MLEKLAVRAGGGSNHRFDLGSGVLIKDNHLAVAGSIAEAVRRARAAAPHGLKIEVEVDTLAQLDEALAARRGHHPARQLRRPPTSPGRCARGRGGSPRPLLEVSGGVTLGRVRELAATGVDIISVGALTHSARAVDLSLELELGGAGAMADRCRDAAAPAAAGSGARARCRADHPRLGRAYEPLAACAAPPTTGARRAAREGAPEGLLVRGRSPDRRPGPAGPQLALAAGQNLYFSLLLRPARARPRRCRR